MEEVRSESEKAKKDFEAVDKRCEMEIAQMTNVLGDYKKEYDRELVAKDQEYEKLKLEYEALRQQVCLQSIFLPKVKCCLSDFISFLFCSTVSLFKL